ncbi:MAG: hypothetical protein HUJ68_03905 [Clostridia bacterium]|nr:hypothetical protein [Clostridia bacterium]
MKKIIFILTLILTCSFSLTSFAWMHDDVNRWIILLENDDFATYYDVESLKKIVKEYDENPKMNLNNLTIWFLMYNKKKNEDWMTKRQYNLKDETVRIPVIITYNSEGKLIAGHPFLFEN